MIERLNKVALDNSEVSNVIGALAMYAHRYPDALANCADIVQRLAGTGGEYVFERCLEAENQRGIQKSAEAEMDFMQNTLVGKKRLSTLLALERAVLDYAHLDTDALARKLILEGVLTVDLKIVRPKESR